jgi:hypothetical protein
MLSLSLLANDPIVAREASDFLQGASIEFISYFIELTAQNRWGGPTSWSVGLSPATKASFATKAAKVVLKHVTADCRKSNSDFHRIVFDSCNRDRKAVTNDILREAKNLGISRESLENHCDQFIYNISNRYFFSHNYELFSRPWENALELAKDDLIQKPVMTLIKAPGCSAFAMGAFLATASSPALVGIHSGLLGFHEILKWLILYCDDGNTPTHETFAFSAAISALLLGLQARDKTRKLTEKLLLKRELTVRESERIKSSLELIFTFILLHEIGHIAKGHITSLQNAFSSGSAISNEQSCRWEFEADEYAVQRLARQWDLDVWLNVIFPAWIMLSHGEEWFVKKESSSTHPRLVIRMVKMIDALLDAGFKRSVELHTYRRYIEQVQSMPLPSFQITMHQWAYLEDNH